MEFQRRPGPASHDGVTRLGCCPAYLRLERMEPMSAHCCSSGLALFELVCIGVTAVQWSRLGWLTLSFSNSRCTT